MTSFCYVVLDSVNWCRKTGGPNNSTINTIKCGKMQVDPDQVRLPTCAMLINADTKRCCTVNGKQKGSATQTTYTTLL